jgi:hypothetical protein
LDEDESEEDEEPNAAERSEEARHFLSTFTHLLIGNPITV